MILTIFAVAIAGFIGYAIGLSQGKHEVNKTKETRK